MTPADPELDDGADEPNEPELDDDDDPELDAEPELDDDPEPVPDDDWPEPDDAAEFPVPLLAGDPAELLLLCAAAGSSAITTPATAAPTIPAPMVALRSRRRAWSRAKMAGTVRSSLFILMAPLGGTTQSVSAALI